MERRRTPARVLGRFIGDHPPLATSPKEWSGRAVLTLTTSKAPHAAPFEQALVRYGYRTFLRRAGELGAALAQLNGAHVTFADPDLARTDLATSPGRRIDPASSP
jgi:hypothetical protein